MRMYDLIEKKRNNLSLSKEEISFIIDGYVKKNIPDYQMSAFLMAIYFNGMNNEEISHLTSVMASSGDIINLSTIKGITVDKHSTGGVGDKTTLIIGPILACAGLKVAKMSGRGLGHTGGTIDKLEAIPGFNVSISNEKFINQVNNVGLSIVSQTGNLAPADKLIYALRDATATVESIPLIASSIMSKKLAAGSSTILLDIKLGSGAFMKTLKDAKILAKTMVQIGNNNGKKTRAVITNMDVPLGRAIGNGLEVMESIDVLKGKGPKDLTDLCIKLSSELISLATNKNMKECYKEVNEILKSGKALNKFKEFVKAQGGNERCVDDFSIFKKATTSFDIISDKIGYITFMDSEKLGKISSYLGSGRNKKDDIIDSSSGLILHSKTGDYVKNGDIIATIYTSYDLNLDSIKTDYLNSIIISKQKKKEKPLIYDIF